MKPPTTGPRTGPINPAVANAGNATTLSNGLQRSDILPPAHTNGVDPKNPARNLNTSCEAMLGATPLAMIKRAYAAIVPIYTGFRPNVSDTGPANSAPQPNPTRYRPVARLSTTGDTPKVAEACGRAALSTELAKPTMKAMLAIVAVQNRRVEWGQLCGFRGSRGPW